MLLNLRKVWGESLRSFLLPAGDERHPEFRAQIDAAGAQGLRLLGGIQIAVSILMYAVRFLVASDGSTLVLRSKQAGLIVLAGLAGIAVSNARAAAHLARWSRWFAVLSAAFTCAVLIWASLLAAAQSTSPNDFIPGEITLVLLVTVTIMPLRPLHTLVLGGAVLAEYSIFARWAEHSLFQGLGPDENYILFIIMLTLLSTGVTAALYAQRWSNYQILQQTIEAAEALRSAQNRILLSENAASLSRLAAALSHEMNNPLGAMLSGMDTLLLLAQRHAAATPQEEPKLIELQAEIRRSIQQSADRLKELIGKLQRFTDLDETEMRQADVNGILRDVVAMMNGAGDHQPRFDLRLESVPAVTCRPQQLAAVFRSLVSNAVNAVNGNGRIAIASRRNIDQIEVEIEDNGHGLSADRIRTIFEPEFRVAGSRVATGNWSMFNSRQIVREHGGDILIASREGEGTRVTVVLPAANA